MSRYQWPGGGPKDKDRPLERQRYNALTDGALLDDAVREARAQRAGTRTPGGPRRRAAASGDADLWVPIGPSVVLLGHFGEHRVSGRVRDLAVAPDGVRAYAASANGGVWFTSDAGLTWAPLGNWLATPAPGTINRSAHSLVSGCLLVSFGAAADGSADLVYCGTGELRPSTIGTPASMHGGVGILKLNKPVPQVLADPFGQHWDRELDEATGYGIYRIAHEPGNVDVLIAATSIGLFSRNAAGLWRRVTELAFNREPHPKVTSDVAWVDVGGGVTRIWLAVRDGSNTGVWTSTTGPAGEFQRVALPNVVRDGRLGVAVAPSDPTVVYVFAKGPRLWRITGVTATQVQKLPGKLFGGGLRDQSDYDLAVAVHPDNKDVVVVGGAGFAGGASLFRFTIAAAGAGLTTGFLDANQGEPERAAKDPTCIGHHVHADVHQIRFVSTGAGVHMWVACDGGVYASSAAGDPHTFIAKNTGLAVLETGFLASHPLNDAYVVAGTQDNGTLGRIGNTVWRLLAGGDGGGVAIHPVKSRNYVAQNTNANWRSDGHLSPPVIRNTAAASEEFETSRAAFYSATDIRRVGATSQVRLAIGTYRVWLADNWDPDAKRTDWVTLPSGIDPRANNRRNVRKDVYGTGSGQVIGCRWARDDRLLALVQSSSETGEDSAVLLFTLGANGKWQRTAISEHANKKHAFVDADIPTPTSTFLPPLGSWSDIAPHNPARGQNGSCYVACTGHVKFTGVTPVESVHMDTLWWYDGAETWHPTGLRTSGTKAPAYAVICDPTTADVVYVGTAIGVWRGTLTFDGTTPNWAWSMFANGLPEAPVHDLSFHNSAGTKILRAAIQARGVWEVDLSIPAGPVRRTFLRVHANDARRTAMTSLLNPMHDGPEMWPWHASPDIRLRPAKLAPGEAIPRPPAGLGFPITGSPAVSFEGVFTPDNYWVWVFQTAMHKLDPLVRPNGRWNPQFEARLIAQNPAARAVIDDARWTQIVVPANVYTTPWDHRGAGAGVGTVPEPSEADLLELIVEDPPRYGLLGVVGSAPAISQIDPRRYNVDVMAHYRDSRPLAGGDLRVALFRRPLPQDETLWPGLPVEPAFKTRIAELMSGSPPAGWGPPAPWTVADTGFRSKVLTSPIDARTPRGVTFETNFAGAAFDDRFLLLAVVHSTPDPVSVASLTGTTLQEFILTCHHVAARVVRIRA